MGLPQSFIDKTLELIIDRGPMPFHDPGGKQVEAHPLTNSHRDALRILQKQGMVRIEYEGDDLIVTYAGPPVPDKMYAALRALPPRAIYVVPNEERQQAARAYIQEGRAAGLWPSDQPPHVIKMGSYTVVPVRDEISGEWRTERRPVAEGARFMVRLMGFHRPITLDHRCVKSAASTVNLMGFQVGTPAAYGENAIAPTIREGFYRFGDPARFHRLAPARPTTREQWHAARRARYANRYVYSSGGADYR